MKDYLTMEEQISCYREMILTQEISIKKRKLEKLNSDDCLKIK